MKLLISLLLLATSGVCSAANHYVSQAGAGSATGTSLANAWSVATYNNSSIPKGGDTVVFSGALASVVTPKYKRFRKWGRKD